MPSKSVTAGVRLTAKGMRWVRQQHPWVYRDDAGPVDPALAGEIVPVQAPNGEPLGQAFCNPHSKILLRWLTQDPDRPLDRAFWEERLTAALALRERVVRDSNACRLVYSEADGFPGLIVDRYGPVLAVQSLSLAMEKIFPVILELLIEQVRPEAVVARNDASVRRLEGLPLQKEVIYGKLPERVEMQEGNLRFLVDVLGGQKTGAYLDQRENHLWARNYARGRVLDAFAYQGGFALQAASGAEEVLALDDSPLAVGWIRENAALNGIKNVRAERANAFDQLRAFEKEGRQFDLIILDPPAFAKNRSEVPDAHRGYREINLRALKILSPGGVLVSCSCSFLVDESSFFEILREASADAHRTVRFLESRTQARDHPILMTHPESRYLKCIALEAA